MDSSVSEVHGQFITGLTTLYTLLTTMAYISPADIIHPPYTASLINTAFLSDLGYDPETISLIKHIPMLHSDLVWGWQEEGTELIPRSKLVNYFVEPQTEWPDYLRWGDSCLGLPGEYRLLEPWMLKLTVGQMYRGQEGVDLVYDLKEKTIIEWSRIGTKLWDESPSQPVEAAFANIINNFKSLAWIPHVSSEVLSGPTTPRVREILENPIIFNNMLSWVIKLPLDHAAAVQQLRDGGNELAAMSFRAKVNQWRAFQKLYKDCGWETGSFDREEFRRRREEWWAEEREMDRRRRIPLSMPDEERRAMDAQFWAEKAGAGAV